MFTVRRLTEYESTVMGDNNDRNRVSAALCKGEKLKRWMLFLAADKQHFCDVSQSFYNVTAEVDRINICEKSANKI